ncbi:hypothetical protein MASR2M79_21330 [Aminivibrio sp.]
MNTDRELPALLLEFQKTETTEHAIYSALADRVKGPNGDILRRIGEDFCLAGFPLLAHSYQKSVSLCFRVLSAEVAGIC